MQRQPTRDITADEQQAFRRDGVVCLREMFDGDWVARMQQAIDDAVAHPGPMHLELGHGQAGTFHGDSFVWTWHDDFRAFVFDSPAAEIARQVLGAQERVTLFFDTLLVKEPGSAAMTPWHHDQPYWPVQGEQVCTVWTPFDPVSRRSGAVEYLIGSHRWGRRFQPQSFTGDDRYGNTLEPLPDIEAMRDRHEFVVFETEPGDCIVHHGLTIHAAPGNSDTTVRRRALAARFCGDDVTYRPEGSFQPLIREPEIESGAPLECDLFPRVVAVIEIGPAAIEQYREDGATVVRGAIDGEWLERLAAAIERDIADPGPFDHSYDVEGGRFHGNLRIWQNDPDFAAFCLDSPAAEIARQVLGARRLNLLYDQLFVKEPGADHRTRWHNDQPYWPIRGRDVISVWVALDHVDAANGRLEFVRGSHRWDRWFQPEPFGPNSGASSYEINPAYEPMLDIEADRDRYDIVTWDLEPGDVYVFAGMTVHGAAGNPTVDRRRRGYTVRYCGDDVVYDPRVGVSAPLLHDGLHSGDRLDSDRFPLVAGH